MVGALYGRLADAVVAAAWRRVPPPAGQAGRGARLDDGAPWWIATEPRSSKEGSKKKRSPSRQSILRKLASDLTMIEKKARRSKKKRRSDRQPSTKTATARDSSEKGDPRRKARSRHSPAEFNGPHPVPGSRRPGESRDAETLPHFSLSSAYRHPPSTQIVETADTGLKHGGSTNESSARVAQPKTRRAGEKKRRSGVDPMHAAARASPWRSRRYRSRATRRIRVTRAGECVHENSLRGFDERPRCTNMTISDDETRMSDPDLRLRLETATRSSNVAGRDRPGPQRST